MPLEDRTQPAANWEPILCEPGLLRARARRLVMSLIETIPLHGPLHRPHLVGLFLQPLQQPNQGRAVLMQRAAAALRQRARICALGPLLRGAARGVQLASQLQQQLLVAINPRCKR